MESLSQPGPSGAGKFTLGRHLTFPHHRSGWAYALEALQPLIATEGLLLDPFTEATFCWDLKTNEASGVLPYRQPWVAIIHNPPGIPEWHEYESAPQMIFRLPAWQESLAYCKGIYVFSETMREWVQSRLPVPVAVAVHPTEPVTAKFSMEKFRANQRPRIIQIGSWLRRLHSIARLPQGSLRKTLLAPRKLPDPHFFRVLSREAANDPAAKGAAWDYVEFLEYQSPEAFDQLLTENLVFLDLYDTVINNTVLECIARHTPIFCNRLPALVEVLGEQYPLFFDSLEDAAEKAEKAELIEEAHRLLAAIPKQRFTKEAFVSSLRAAEFFPR